MKTSCCLRPRVSCPPRVVCIFKTELLHDFIKKLTSRFIYLEVDVMKSGCLAPRQKLAFQCQAPNHAQFFYYCIIHYIMYNYFFLSVQLLN